MVQANNFYNWWKESGWKGNADVDAAFEAWEAALEFCCKAIDEIDDGEAPEYRACQEAIKGVI